MQKRLVTAPPQIKVTRGTKFCADVAELATKFPQIETDGVVKKIERALRADPIQPHRQGGGTPLCKGVLHIRVPNSSADDGGSGGFRMRYSWQRTTGDAVLLDIALRRDDTRKPRKAVKKLLEKR
jgi:hypothetical protein